PRCSVCVLGNLLDVQWQYVPKNTSLSAFPSGLVMEGNPVTLSCSSDANPAVNYTWYRDTERPLNPCCQVIIQYSTKVLTSTVLAVLFVSPSKIALEKIYHYCPPHCMTKFMPLILKSTLFIEKLNFSLWPLVHRLS
uniref:Ig-like domain-containing protein n=1 Tax=Cyprinus carpio TaxID=7962 RepID=A0A8C2C6Y5_CYPCA